MFSIGEKVVCIHTFTVRPDAAKLGETNPIKGEMYTIRTIECHKDGCFLRFEELINPVLNYANGKTECQFCSTRFRKLDPNFAEELLEKLSKENLINKKV